MLGMGEKMKQCHHVFIVQQTCSARLASTSLVLEVLLVYSLCDSFAETPGNHLDYFDC